MATNVESSLTWTLSPTQLSSPQTEKKTTGLATIGGLGDTEILITPKVPATNPATATLSSQPTMQEQEELKLQDRLLYGALAQMHEIPRERDYFADTPIPWEVGWMLVRSV